MKKKKDFLQKQLEQVQMQEMRYFNKSGKHWIKEKVSPIASKVEEKIPPKLEETLNLAFFKGFQIIFEKGDKIIEKTFAKEQILKEHSIKDYTIDVMGTKKAWKMMDKYAKASKRMNRGVSVVEGAGLGFFGVGLPDIPIFLAVILKSAYQIGLNYGYVCDTKEERIYLLRIICAALEPDAAMKWKMSKEVDALAAAIDQGNGETEESLENLIEETSRYLAREMLLAKFVQGFFAVGVIGGVTNYQTLGKITTLVSIKYKKRYLLKKRRQKEMSLEK